MARRLRRVGIWKPWICRPLAKSSEETSGSTCMRMLPLLVMFGVKFSRMPNSLKTIVIVVPPELTCGTGYGNSPPARNEASLPSMASRLGSARLLNIPFPWSARMNAPISDPRSNRYRLVTSENVCSGPGGSLMKLAPGAVNVPVESRPSSAPRRFSGSTRRMLKPSSLSALRLTSANRTWSRTCRGDGTEMLLTTVAPEASAIATARRSTLASLTDPDRMNVFPLAWTTRFSFGNRRPNWR